MEIFAFANIVIEKTIRVECVDLSKVDNFVLLTSGAALRLVTPVEAAPEVTAETVKMTRRPGAAEWDRRGRSWAF